MTDETAELPMFPLGSVLFPAMPLPLRVFEERYLEMLQDALATEPGEFGVVLIERGSEVGGGDQRFSLGTVAQVARLQVGDGFLSVLTEGTDRVEVVEWLPDRPYPRAIVRRLPALTWDESSRAALEATELVVRRTMSRASEFDDLAWSPGVGLADDPVEAAWQLAAIAPIGELDRVRLLAAATVDELLDAVSTATREAGETFDLR